jgi:hypothetical protein
MLLAAPFPVRVVVVTADAGGAIFVPKGVPLAADGSFPLMQSKAPLKLPQRDRMFQLFAHASTGGGLAGAAAVPLPFPMMYPGQLPPPGAGAMPIMYPPHAHYPPQYWYPPPPQLPAYDGMLLDCD